MDVNPIRRPKPLVAGASASEVSQAVAQCEFPPLLIWDGQGTILLANNALAQLVGQPLSELTGRLLADFVDPPEVAQRVAAEVSGGTFDAYRATRRVRTANHEICARIWTQAIDVDGRRLGVSVVVDEADMGRLGKHPKKARLDLVPIAVGALDDAWTIVSVSTEIEDLIHRSASECAGLCLLDLVHPDDAAGLRGQDGKPGGEPLYRAYVRFSDPVTGWSEACMMIGPLPGRPEHLFALVGALESGQQPSWDRVAELEMALRRIGAEVRAAGALEMIGGIATPVLPQLGELSTRQWEVLSRLLQGERVSTIARELYLSESTVRNHLATIFRRFRVHTQSELLELLRGKTAGAQ